jgi:hypothetical protein
VTDRKDAACPPSVCPQGSKLPLLAKVLGKVKGTVTGGVVYWGEAPAEAVKVSAPAYQGRTP